MGAGASRPSGFLPGDLVHFAFHVEGDGGALVVFRDDHVPDEATLRELGGDFGFRSGPCVVVQATEVCSDDQSLRKLEFVAVGTRLTIDRGHSWVAYTWESYEPYVRRQQQEWAKRQAEYDAFMLANPDYDALEELAKDLLKDKEPTA